MPIYAYRCEACGFAKDVLQKVSDPQLTVCLSCGEPTFKKQLTAAGFQLKGTGWYATDFRNGSGTAAPAGAGNAGEATGDAKAGADKTGSEKSTGERASGDKPVVSTGGNSTANNADTGTSSAKGGADKAAPAAASPQKAAAPATGAGSSNNN